MEDKEGLLLDDEQVKVLFDVIVSYLKFKNKLRTILFGKDYQTRVSINQLTDDKLLEAVRMLKEVY